MNLAFLPLPISLVLIVLYLLARNRQDLKRTAIIQPLTTLLSMVIAGLSLLEPATHAPYTIWILVGLGLCFAADIFNIDMNNDKIFFLGMAFFVVAYLEYAVVYTMFNNGFHQGDLLVGGIFLVLYILLMTLYWPKLGKYKLPVMVYGLVMPFMVTRAISTLSGGIFPTQVAVLVTAGSLMLFIGDVEYGMQRFYKPGKFTVGPICYAGGQLLIALSCVFFILP